MPMRQAVASRGPDSTTASPLTKICPASGAYRPAATFISDDLPAPFSPNSAWTSPALASNSASSRATNPSNDFLTPTSLRAATITALQGSKAWRRFRAAPRSSFNLLFLRDHAGNIPIHLPQIGVADD